MIGIVHGYGLGGAGSNLWTREAVSALCDIGETVHLMCQESNPERLDFVTELRVYDGDGPPDVVFRREPVRAARCVVHRPRLDVLPTYVRPDRPSSYIRSILDLDDDAIEAYVERNLAALRRVAADEGVVAWHVNHAVLMSEALRRLRAEGLARFAVMPHGSALEYVVKHDPRMQRVARQVFQEADRIFALNQEIRDRLALFFPDLELAAKTVTVRVGVDVERFRPVPTHGRAESVERLAAALADVERGREPEHAGRLADALDRVADGDAFRALLGGELACADGPDTDLETKLREVAWDLEPMVAFVGRLMPAKGVAALVAAFPRVLERHPRARLLLVGGGWMREYLEGFVLALRRGDGELAWRVLQWAGAGHQEGARPFAEAFLQRLRDDGGYEEYVESARRHLTGDRVLFTGYLDHDLVAHVFPLADVAVFPSAVAEASPLVIPEAAACGCLPMGTDFAGMKNSLDSLAPRLPAALRPLMRIRPDAAHAVDDIVGNVRAALDARAAASAGSAADPGPALRQAAVDEYDWRAIAGVMAAELRGLIGSDRTMHHGAP